MTTLSIPDMTCGHCKASVESAIASVDASATVAVDLETHRVEVQSTAQTATLIAALHSIGYSASLL